MVGTYGPAAFVQRGALLFLSLFSMRMGSRASLKSFPLLNGAAARRHLERMSACQWRSQKRRRDVILVANALEANLAAAKMASVENSKAATNLLTSWWKRMSSGTSLDCNCLSHTREVLLKKDAAIAAQIAQAAAWCELWKVCSALRSSAFSPQMHLKGQWGERSKRLPADPWLAFGGAPPGPGRAQTAACHYCSVGLPQLAETTVSG